MRPGPTAAAAAAAAAALLVALLAAGALAANPGPGELADGPMRASDHAQAPFLPTLYRTKANEWGCCRLCGKEETERFRKGADKVAAAKKAAANPAAAAAAAAKVAKEAPKPPRPVPLQFEDPSRHVNCCPFCPWPSTNSGKASNLGPYEHYYTKQEPSERDKYTRELDSFERPGLPKYKPVNPDLMRYYDPAEDNEDAFLEENAALPSLGGLKGLASQVGLGKTVDKATRTVNRAAKQAGRAGKAASKAAGGAAAAAAGGGGGGESSGADPMKAGPYDMGDPYVAIRGFEMKRSQNFVYGYPERAPVPGDVASRADLPPCCNVCERSHETLLPKGDSTCCVHCASTLVGHAPWRTRREKAAMEEKMEARKTKGGTVAAAK